MSSRSSKTEAREPARTERRNLPERVTVGRVLKPHGLRGDVVVEVLSDVPDRLAPGSRLAAVAGPEAPAAGKAASSAMAGAIELEVAASRAHGAGCLLRFTGRDSRDAVEELRGLWLTVERAAVPAPPAGTYYHYQLVGCRVRDAEAGELGEVVDLVEDGGGLLLLVSDGARQVPVPFVASFLAEVDVASGRIELVLPPGFLEACASRS